MTSVAIAIAPGPAAGPMRKPRTSRARPSATGCFEAPHGDTAGPYYLTPSPGHSFHPTRVKWMHPSTMLACVNCGHVVMDCMSCGDDDHGGGCGAIVCNVCIKRLRTEKAEKARAARKHKVATGAESAKSPARGEAKDNEIDSLNFLRLRASGEAKDNEVDNLTFLRLRAGGKAKGNGVDNLTFLRLRAGGKAKDNIIPTMDPLGASHPADAVIQCPSCNKPVTTWTLPHAVRRVIRRHLLVQCYLANPRGDGVCPNVGCDWKGHPKAYSMSHEGSCPHRRYWHAHCGEAAELRELGKTHEIPWVEKPGRMAALEGW